MIRMAGEAVGTEGDDEIRSDAADRLGDAVDRGFVVDQVAFAVAVAEQPNVVDAELAKAGT